MILILNSSPRKKNCFDISQTISAKLNDQNIQNRIYNIYDMEINYCTFCGYCEKIKGCKFKDEMIYDEFDKAYGVIVVSPVCFNSTSAKLKTLVDRTQAIYASKYILNDSIIDRSKKRIGMYIAIGGSNIYENQFDGGQILMDFFFKSINNKLKYNLRFFNSDKVDFKEKQEFRNILDENLEKYIEEVKGLN
ncbi:MAG: flavodoxin family protein [Peptostreptococcaceae bacterium]